MKRVIKINGLIIGSIPIDIYHARELHSLLKKHQGLLVHIPLPGYIFKIIGIYISFLMIIGRGLGCR